MSDWTTSLFERAVVALERIAEGQDRALALAVVHEEDPEVARAQHERMVALNEREIAYREQRLVNDQEHVRLHQLAWERAHPGQSPWLVEPAERKADA